MRLIGYARVSTEDQELGLQLDALRAAGCAEIREEKASGGRWDRPELQNLLASLGPDDVLCVWKLDRLSRSLGDLLRIWERVEAAGAGFRSLTEAIDTTTPAGRLLAHMLGAVAEYERAMTRQRINAGLAAAKRRGSHLGRRPKLSAHQRACALEMLQAGRAQAEVARLFAVDRAMVCRLAKSTV